MKKKILTLLFLPLIVFGQDKSFELGLLCGGSLNSLNGLESRGGLTNMSFKNYLYPRILGGGLAQYNFNNRFSLKSKLLYHIKGEQARIEPLQDVEIPDADYRSDFHYITLPLLAQFNFGKNRWGFFCNTGFYLSSLIKAKTFYIGGEESDVLEKVKKLDFGLILGSGVSFQFTERMRVFIESSLDYGLINISKSEGYSQTTANSDDVALTQAITGSVGLTYSIWSNKKKTFNGMSTLDCPDYEESQGSKQKKKTKWRLILYKDGEKVGGKSKKGKSRLFKKKD